MNNSNSEKNNRTKGHKYQWYKDGLRFECQRCGSCCRGEPGVVWMNKKETKNVSMSLGVSIDIFTKKYIRLINGRISLLEHDNGDCVMYNNGCKIYETRPRQCKTFPFWSSNLKNKTEWEEQKKTCHGIGKGELHTPEEIDHLLRPELRDL